MQRMPPISLLVASLLVVAVVCLTTADAADLTLEIPLSRRPLVVCTQNRPPMSFCTVNSTDPNQQGAKNFTGFSLEMFRQAASLIDLNGSAMTEGVDYKFLCLDKTATQIIDDLASNAPNRTCDLAIAAITISIERQSLGVQFAYPYYKASVGIITKSQRSANEGWAWTEPFSWDLWLALGLTLVLFPVLVVFLELTASKRNLEWKQVPDRATESMWNSMWTLLHGDKYDSDNSASKAAMLCFAFFSLIVVSSYTANLAAFLTVKNVKSGITSVNDLRGKAVSTVPVYIPRLRQLYGIVPSEAVVSSYDDVLKYAELVRQGELAAFLYDEPMARTAAASFPNCQVNMLPEQVVPFDYGLALAKNSSLLLLNAFSGSILKLWEDGEITKLRDNFITNNNIDSCSAAASLKQGTPAITFMQLWGLWIVLAAGFAMGLLLMMFVRWRKRKNWQQEQAKAQQLGVSTSCVEEGNSSDGLGCDSGELPKMNGVKSFAVNRV